MGRFIMVDCAECGTPEIGLTNCEFSCGAGFCEHCWPQAKQCAGCGQTGCEKHFDGLFCFECIRVEQEEINDALKIKERQDETKICREIADNGD